MSSSPSTARAIAEALGCSRPGCQCRRNSINGEWVVHCPAHNDQRPSLAISEKDGKVLLHCHAGCTQEAVIAVLRERGLWHQVGGGVHTQRFSVQHCNTPGLTLGELAAAKKIAVEFLRGLGLSDFRYNGIPCVRIPYYAPDGDIAGVRFRLAMLGACRFVWRRGDHTALYGLERLPTIRQSGWVLLVEGNPIAGRDGGMASPLWGCLARPPGSQPGQNTSKVWMSTCGRN